MNSCSYKLMGDNERVNTRWLSSRELSSWVRLASILEALPPLLDSQLRRDAGLTHFDYRVLAQLSETEGCTVRMSFLAKANNSTLPRLSHVIQRLEERGYVERLASAEDRRATDVRLTDEGWEKIRSAAPGHVETVREHVLDPLTEEQVDQLGAIAEQILRHLDPDGELRPVYGKHDEA